MFSNGGGLHIETGNVTIIKSSIISNTAEDGGGINNSGTLSISESVISSNTGTFQGGGINFENGASGLLESSIVEDNTANYGGGIHLEISSITITHSSINNNSSLHGGGINTLGTSNLNITNSSFYENNATNYGGGLYAEPETISIIKSSTFFSNTSETGGGIHNHGQLEGINLTICHNEAINEGGGIWSRSVLLFPGSGTITLTNATITNNTAPVGGGIFHQANTKVKNTLLADNSNDNCNTSLISTGHNIDSGNSCGFMGSNDQINTDPILGQLQDNGGETFTHALLFGSPAIDAGDNLACPSIDQRDEARPTDGNGDGTAVCDIGAYEYEAVSSTPTLIINDTAVTEGNTSTTQATFTVTLSMTSTNPITVSYESVPDTAVSHIDHFPISGTLTFAPGELTKTLGVSVIGDTFDEDDETFFINLSDPVNASIGDGQGMGTVLDDDDPPEMSISDAVVMEGNTDIVSTTFTVTLSTASGKMTSITYETADSTTIANQDYKPFTGTLTFAPGDISKTLTAQVHGDTIVEDNETFLVLLSNPMNCVISDPQGTGTILNDDFAVYLPMINKP